MTAPLSKSRREWLGHSKRKEYQIWGNIVQRCTNPNNPAFERYGADGITICEEWRLSFDAFFAHLGPRPGPLYSVDRIDGTRGYEPGNVRWATAYEQAQNQTKTRYFSAFGATRCLSEWARVMRLPISTLWRRIEILGWPIERALATPNLGRVGTHAKLSLKQVAEIRRRAADGETAKGLAGEFGVGKLAVYRVITGRTFTASLGEGDGR